MQGQKRWNRGNSVSDFRGVIPSREENRRNAPEAEQKGAVPLNILL